MKFFFNFFYEWALPKLTDYLNQYQDNEQMTKLVKAYWYQLQSYGLWFFLIAAVVALLLAYYYYGPYNNRPGRHYKSKYWLTRGGMAAACAFALTFCVGLTIKCHIPSIWRETIGRITLMNGVYSIVVYLILSFVVCQFPMTFKTNAYPVLKLNLKKK